MNTILPAVAYKREPKHLVFRIICLMVSIALLTKVQAQTEDSTTFKATGAFFALSVADVNASSKWYTEKLGLKLTKQIPKQDKVAVAILEGSGLIIELIQNDDALPLAKAAPGVKDNILVHGFFKAGVIVEDLGKLISLFKERSVEIAYGPYPSRPDQRANVIIRDNSGNLIQFFGK